MAQTIARIHLGSARVFVGVTVAVTGTPPTYTGHTDGVPATGTDVGSTEGDASFEQETTKQEIDTEQSLAPVAVYAVAQSAQLTFTCMEHVYVAMQMGFDNIGKEDVALGEGFWFGNGTGILTPTTTCVMLTSRQPLAPTKFVVVQLYKAYIGGGMKVTFGKKKGSYYQVTLKAVADLTRNAGDMMCYYRYETAA